tara:strand:+ start:1229 stop:2818 length:1590 start_codon:yes stop_codon:yes gene_type:complete
MSKNLKGNKIPPATEQEKQNTLEKKKKKGTSRRPNQATEEEIEQFIEQTKKILGKVGMYYDPITDTFKNAVEQNGKQRGSDRSLKLNRKFAGYLRRVKGEEQEILKDASERAIKKGFSTLQKERKEFKRLRGSAKKEEEEKDKKETEPTKQEKKKNKQPKTDDTLIQQGARRRDRKRQIEEEQRVLTEPNPNVKVPENKVEALKKAGAKRRNEENIRLETIEANDPDAIKQKQKIQNVKVNVDGSTETLAGASGEVDDVKLPEDTIPEIPTEPEQPDSKPTPEPTEEATQEESPVPPQSTSQFVDPTTEDERVVEEIRPVPSFTAPSTQKVSMERNRQKYSPEKLRAEIKAFITIYKDDIKTARFKKLAKTKLEGLSLDKLRDLHRSLEEEVIEYYRKDTGLRLGVIIDPAVLGLSVQRLQGVLNPNITLPSAPIVRDVGRIGNLRTGDRQVTKSADTHYAVGGLLQATKSVLPEGKKLQEEHDPEIVRRKKNQKFSKTRINIPVKPPMRHLYQPSRNVKLPSNLKIRS